MSGSLSQLVQRFESGGNYAAINPASSASGAYGFLNSTWTQYLNQIVPGGSSQYPSAASAPADVQDAVFAEAVSQNGLADWTCPGCDAKLTSYLASNPSASSLPIFSGGSSSPATSQGGTAGAAQPARSGSSFNPITALTNWLSNIASRVGLFVLALLFIFGAIVLLGIRSGIQIERTT